MQQKKIFPIALFCIGAKTPHFITFQGYDRAIAAKRRRASSRDFISDRCERFIVFLSNKTENEVIQF